MRAARQHGIGEQLDLFDEALKAVLGLDPGMLAPAILAPAILAPAILAWADPRPGRARSRKLTRRGNGNEP